MAMIEEPLGTVDRREYGTLRVTFADVTGGDAVASAVTFRFRDGLEGDVVEVESPAGSITEVSDNVWTCRHRFMVAGRCFVEAEATAGLGAIVAGWVMVRPSAFD